MDKLLRSSFSTKDLESVDGVSTSDVKDAWRDAMSVFFTPDPIKDEHLAELLGASDETSGHIDSFLFPGMMSINVAASGQYFSRTSQDIARDGLDGILVQFWRDGAMASNDQRSQITGNIHIVDFSRTTDAITSDFDTYNLLIPREALAEYADLDTLHEQVLSTDLASVRLLTRHIYNLHQEADHMTAHEAQSLVAPTIAMISATLTSHADALEASSQLVDRNVLLEIKQYIDANLTNPKLNADLISLGLGLSRSSLYRLSEPLGGLQNFIRNRRLRRVFQILASQGNDIKSISALAYSQGFQSEDTFRRAFKNAFGMSPAEVKQQGMNAYGEYYTAVEKDEEAMPLGDRLYKKWVSDLFS